MKVHATRSILVFLSVFYNLGVTVILFEDWLKTSVNHFHLKKFLSSELVIVRYYIRYQFSSKSFSK